MKTFTLSGDAAGREMVTRERAVELMQPITDAANAAGADGTVAFDKIQLSGKSFGLEAAEVVGEALARVTGVTVLDFSDVMSGRSFDDACVILARLTAPAACWPLVELNLSDNALGSAGVRACRAAMENKPQLARVYLNNDGLEHDAGDLLRDLFLANATPSVLTTFHIYNNLLKDAGAISLAPLFAKSPALTDLRLATTRVSEDGCRAVVQALVDGAQQFTHLDLSDNSMGADVVKLLARRVVARQKGAVKLQLSDVSGEEGIRSLLTALTRPGCSPTLTSLSLSDNEIGEDNRHHARLLSTALASKPALTHLDLEGNALGSAGAALVLDTLSTQCPALHSLNIAGNAIKGTTPLTKALHECLRSHSSSSSAAESSEAADSATDAGSSAWTMVNVNNNAFTAAQVSELRAVMKSLGDDGENEAETLLGTLSDNDDDPSDDDDDADEADDDDDAGSSDEEWATAATGADADVDELTAKVAAM